MKKGLSLILTAVFLTAMLMVGGMSALAAGEADPEDAKSVLDLSYLTKDQALDGSAGAAVYQDQAFDNSKLKLSCVTVDGKDWLKYEYGAWFNGLLVDLNTAKGQDPAKGVTDWTGATMVWFYVDAENGATLDLQLRAVKGEDTGFFSSKNAGVKYYYQDEHGNVPVTLADDNNDWGHISLAEGYEGWVGVELANFACGSGHLTDQNLSSYLGNVTGVGFYAEKTFLVRDIRVTGVAKGLAGLGALFYVAYRVWQSLARAEPIDVFPLLRPFALGICIMFFPTIVLGTLNSILSPVVTGTHRILETQTFDMNEYRQQKDKLEIEAMRRNPETAYLVDKEAFDNKLDELGALDAIEACGMYVDRAMYNMKKSVQNFFRELLELMFNAAALVVDTLRTFFLIVLSILGPISFAISCWDGFQASLSQWFVRYISIYLWLPVSDLFSSVLARIQTLMLQRDIEQLSDPNFIPDSSNAVYITFLIIGIIGYFTIPTVANWIVQAGGGAGNYGKNVNQAASKTGSIVGGAAGATVGNVAGRLIK